MSWIVLVGQRACGKTSIGQELAKVLNIDFVDLDDEIEKREKKKIIDIFEVFGEKYFRKQELKSLLSLPKKKLVLSTGGGLITQADALSFLKQRGVIIHIEVSQKELLNRRKNDKTRPLLYGSSTLENEIEKSFEIRESLYIKNSNMTLNCNALSLDESVNKMVKLIEVGK
ncbi:MAG: hypothetical protein COB02_07740 [Candidatus Cloacimonadota bacterium]|nr:MAG: hypothetical protein COB02_07740 [Candidatus Cloacimonadota bacterium]